MVVRACLDAMVLQAETDAMVSKEILAAMAVTAAMVTLVVRVVRALQVCLVAKVAMAATAWLVTMD